MDDVRRDLPDLGSVVVVIPGGLLTRRELRALGVSDVALHRLVVARRLMRVGRAQYALPGEPTSHELVLARPGRGAMLSHASAARVWGLPVTDRRCHITVANGGRRRWASDEVVVHQTRQPEAGEVRADVVVSSLERTIVDSARTMALPDAVALIDAGLGLGAGLADLTRRLQVGSPGASVARRALELADGRSESPLESRLRVLLVLGGLPPDDVQHVVREHGRFGARVDLWYDGVVVEADGFAFHSDRAAYRRDRRRMQLFARLGLLHLPFSWEDVEGRPDDVVASVCAALRTRAA